MALTYNASFNLLEQTGNPISFNYTTSGDPGVIVMGLHATSTIRIGADPTFGGIPFTMAGRNKFDYGEGSGELWFILEPSAGTYSISMENNQPASTVSVIAVSFNHDVGSYVSFDTSSWINTTQANPTATINCSDNGAIVQFCSHEANTTATAFSDERVFSASLSKDSTWMQFKDTPTEGNNTLSATQTSNEYVLITASFRQRPLVLEYGGIMKYYNGVDWIETPPDAFKTYINGSWTIVPEANWKIYRDGIWKPIRMKG